MECVNNVVIVQSVQLALLNLDGLAGKSSHSCQVSLMIAAAGGVYA